MPKTTNLVFSSVICLIAVVITAGAQAPRRTIIYDRLTTQVTSSPPTFGGSDDLWITLADLTRATKFVLKPQGVCRDELCFPIPKARRQAFLSQQGRVTWFNLMEFARLLRQPVALDKEHSVWFFGPRPSEQNDYLYSLVAPDFALPDINGRQHSLKDYRGKKVLLLTWASW